MAGAPKGNKNAARAHLTRTALIKALEEAGGENINVVSKLKPLVKICAKQIEKALEGDNESAKIIFDRLDGKPAQALNIGGQEDNPVEVITKLSLDEIKALNKVIEDDY